MHGDSLTSGFYQLILMDSLTLRYFSVIPQ